MSSPVNPRSASVAEETSMKMRSSCVPTDRPWRRRNAQKDIPRALGEVVQLRHLGLLGPAFLGVPLATFSALEGIQIGQPAES
jgi:hypothetical protein